jgi:NADH-quinone oxidoreductase subunit N
VIDVPLLAVTTDDQVFMALTDSFAWVVPEIILGLAACVLFLGGTFRPSRHLWGGVTLAALLLAGLALWMTVVPKSAAVAEADVHVFNIPLLLHKAGAAVVEGRLSGADVFASPLLLDALAFWVKAVAIVGGLVLLLLSWDEVPDSQAAEYHGCLLVIVAGLCLTGAANDLVTLFLALELVSIPSYVLLYLPRHDSAAQEAALKYFLLSVFSSGLLLFGFSYLYGLAGTTNIPALLHEFTTAVAKTSTHQAGATVPVLTQVALIMVVAGLGFRITAVPFHFYAPDVYQGAPTSVAALLAFVPKVAGFAALLRVLGFVLPREVLVNLPPGVLENPLWVVGRALGDQVPILFWILAAVTMFMGNLLGLLQTNVKRILAYSSVAHAGYMLIGLAAAPYLAGATGSGGTAATGGVETVLFYLVAYGAMTLGAFAVLTYLSTPQRPVETLDDLNGVSRSHPGVALLMLLFLFSLIGIPFTAGFAGKFMLFFGAMAVQSSEHAMLYRVLALLGVLNAAIGAWYYLRIIAVMYLRTTVRPIEKKRTWPGLATLWICAVVTVGAGFHPGADWLLKATQKAAGPGLIVPGKK